MKKLLTILILIICNLTFAHSINNSEHNQVRKWGIKKENKSIKGSFYMFKNGTVYIEDTHNHIVNFPLTHLSKIDQTLVLKKQKEIIQLNKEIQFSNKKNNERIPDNTILSYVKIGLIVLLLFLLIFIHVRYSDRQKIKYLIPILCVGIITLFSSFLNKDLSSQPIEKSTTDPSFLDAAFMPFEPNVNTYSDANYFYVESKGIATTHEMMVGISNHGWQQQVPIPQCYLGSNSWSIPLNPVIASTPIPANSSHFLRGAIALAVNGIPIFNVHTNTGVDSYLDGQLDAYGGHCGRGDDYHYHIAPLHLYNYTAATNPIAFALDGFAVYGSLEPDGSSMTTLDGNHGHYGTNGVYHYHGTSTSPYMIGNMVGQVTEDITLQIIPQAHASPVRTENWTPLSGALITSCTLNGSNNGYNLTYTLGGTSGYATNYSWNNAGLYTFNYSTPSGTTNTNYNGFTQCTLVSTSGLNESKKNEKDVLIYPNPVNEILHIKLNNSLLEKEIQSTSIYNLKGELILKLDKFKQDIDVKTIAHGTYILKIVLPTYQINKRIIIK